MNKETRQFIWGFFGTILCCGAVAIHLIEIHNGTWENLAWSWILLVCSTIGIISFATTLYKSLR